MQQKPHWLMLLCGAFLFCAVLAPTRVKTDELPLAGAAYTAASQAYAAFKSGDLKTAAAKAKEAISARPDSLKLRLLLIDITVASGNLSEADALANEAHNRFGDDADLDVRRKTISDQLAYKTRAGAYEAADQALKAFAKQDYTAAADNARQAVRIDPKNASYRLILVNALIAADAIDDARTEVDQAIAAVGNDPELAKRKQYINERIAARPIADAFAAADEAYKAYDRKDYALAETRAREAIKLDPDNSSYRELLKNVLRTKNAPAQATQSPGGMLAQRGYNKFRRRDFAGAARDFSAALRMHMTGAQARNTRLALADAYQADHRPEEALHTLAPLGSRGYDVTIRRGYALQTLERNEEALDAFRHARSAGRGSKDRATAISSEIMLLAKLGRKAEARSEFDQALSSGELQPLPAADLANLALAAGNERVALDYYRIMREKRTLHGHAAVNAGYVATKLRRNADAISYFEGALDDYDAGMLPINPQEVFTLRRQISEMSRTWGAYMSSTYSKTGAGPTIPLATPSKGGAAIQNGLEIYARPFGYMNGSVFDVFVRGFETSFSETGGTGWRTTQGMAGARWKPIGSINWILEVAKVFKIGDAARDDVLLRTAISFGQGTDLRVDVPQWFTWQFYADFNYFTELPQKTANADFRIGQSFRLDSLNRNLVLFPHLGAFASYDDSLGKADAYAVGAGATLRYWFREDRYHAPMSYIDLTGQYRVRIAGDDRAQGPFVQVLVSY
jgi:tetratricopeptide (TPR) repeat protein